MRSGLNSEYNRVARILVRAPGTAFVSQNTINGEWEELNYSAPPRFEESIREFGDFVDLLETHGGEVVYLVEDSPLLGLDSLYVRDATVMTSKGVVIGKMGKNSRKDEPGSHKRFYEGIGHTILGEIDGKGTLEGGDTAWMDESTLAVGHGYRSNAEGIRQLRNLVKDFAEVIEVHLPHYMGSQDVFHLMSIYSPVDKDLAVVYSPLMPVPFRNELIRRGVKLIEVPKSEFDSLGCNVLAIAPRVVVVEKSNPQTIKLLRDTGVEVLTYKGQEISQKGCGGPTCLTRPIVRI